MVRYGLVTIGLSVGVWGAGVLLAIAFGLVGYLISPTSPTPATPSGTGRGGRAARAGAQPPPREAGRAVALSALGRSTQAAELAAREGLSLTEAIAVLDSEPRTVIA